MTFTKEKLAELELSLNKVKSGIKPELGFCLYAGSLSIAQDMQPLFEAATALPHYITALAEAERALDIAERALSNYSFVASTGIGNEAHYALTTIRQLARGKE